ncbi:MAG: ATP-binding protein [Eubacteriales bacterium]|nr:ATP-binding protein [Eubacteriales bacterium]
MKIRQRLALISILLIAVSLAVCGTLLLGASAKSSIGAAEEGALTELNLLRTSYQSVLQDVSDPTLSETAQRSLALYLFRQYISINSQFILIRNGETLYNNSDYAVDQLLNGETEKTIDRDGKKLFLAAAQEDEYQSGSYQIFLVRDVSSVYTEIRSLTLKFVLICTAAFLLSAAVVMFSTFRALRPLKLLQRSAAAIADGVYDRRIEVRGKDEIAELAASFNKMADAVSRHIDEVTATAEERKLLLGALTHELKTPMTSIIGYSESLQKTKLSSAQKTEAVSYINRECGRLERLTQKMMRLITLTGGEEIERVPISAAALFSAVEPTLRDAASRQGANLTFTDSGACYRVDADLMASVLINLVDNACSAGAKHIRITAASRSIAVADDGCGIAPELVRRVTQPFFRADKARSRRQGHAGLGLALVSRIVELHNGVLAIESEVGSGTTMTIRFSD